MVGEKSKINGNLAEKLAEDILKEIFIDANIEYLNELIDYYINGRFVEVKSCDQWIADRSHSNGRRRGRFVFNKTQHEFLLEQNGLYLFIVRCDAGKSYFKLKRAVNVPVSFKNCDVVSISWKKIWDD